MYQKETGKELEFKNYFNLKRGPYEIISVVDENADQSPYTIKGKLIDLFDPEIPVVDEKQVNPGEQAFLFNIGSVENPEIPQVLATAARVYDENVTDKEYSFVVKGPLNTTNVMRILLPKKADLIEVHDHFGNVIQVDIEWDEPSKTCFLSFENYPDGVNVKLSW